MSTVTLGQNDLKSDFRMDIRAFALFFCIGFFLFGMYHLKNNAEEVAGSISIAKISQENMDDITPQELEGLEKELQTALELAEQGLPLTPKEMEQIEKLYKVLLKKGAMSGGVVDRILKLIPQLVMASGTTEVYLEHLQNSENDTDYELHGVGAR